MEQVARKQSAILQDDLPEFVFDLTLDSKTRARLIENEMNEQVIALIFSNSQCQSIKSYVDSIRPKLFKIWRCWGQAGTQLKKRRENFKACRLLSSMISDRTSSNGSDTIALQRKHQKASIPVWRSVITLIRDQHQWLVLRYPYLFCDLFIMKTASSVIAPQIHSFKKTQTSRK